jgi:RNA methyltransferase, TrmH family
MKNITSVNNEIIKETTRLQQKKYRNQTGLFLIEGSKAINEAVSSNIDIIKIFVQKGFELPLNWKNFDIYEITEPVMKKISTTETPPEVIAIAKQKKYSMEDLFKSVTENPIIIVIEGIKDAGNLGTIIRTAAAGNISGIVLTGDTVDLYNPKTVRSAAGNLWKIPVVEINDNLKKTLLKHKKCKFFAAVVNNAKKTDNCFIADFKGPSVIMFGSEADGLSKNLINQADCFINIPMKETVESLNLSISVGIIVYEALRQRLYS